MAVKHEASVQTMPWLSGELTFVVLILRIVSYSSHGKHTNLFGGYGPSTQTALLCFVFQRTGPGPSPWLVPAGGITGTMRWLFVLQMYKCY